MEGQYIYIVFCLYVPLAIKLHTRNQQEGIGRTWNAGQRRWRCGLQSRYLCGVQSAQQCRTIVNGCYRRLAIANLWGSWICVWFRWCFFLYFLCGCNYEKGIRIGYSCAVCHQTSIHYHDWSKNVYFNLVN